MSDPKDKNGPGPRDDADLTDEIRRRRPYNLAEAVGREAAGNLKGASPVAPDRQLLLAVGELLATHLPDNEGSLVRTILVRLEGNPPLLAQHPGRPAGVLRDFLDSVLASRLALSELVRQVDARWARDYGEKPRFESPDQPPPPDDPYTVAGVGARLRDLRNAISAQD